MTRIIYDTLRLAEDKKVRGFVGCFLCACLFLFFVSLSMATPSTAHEPIEIVVRSDSFADGDSIPVRYTCDGEDISPHLAWGMVPSGTMSLVVSIDDPDAPRGTWNHWYLYNISPSVRELPEGASEDRTLPTGSIEALNDFKKHTYGGPCPPIGRHRYLFRVRALEIVLEHKSFLRSEVEEQVRGHVIAEGRLLGLYGPRSH